MDEGSNATTTWIQDAFRTRGELRHVQTKHGTISYKKWSQGQSHSLLFVHGNSAHAGWWDHIAPAFIDDQNVAALDLFGMGSSDWLDAYSTEILAAGILSFVEFWAPEEAPTIVAHSFGGRVCIKAKQMAPKRLGPLVLLDMPFYPPGHQFEWAGHPIPARPVRTFDTLDEAAGTFRFTPPTHSAPSTIKEHIARSSYKTTPEGWVLKADPQLFPQIDYLSLVRDLPSDELDLKGCILGGNSPLFTSDLVVFNKHITASVPVIEIDDAGHHLFLDQPSKFTRVLREMLDEEKE